MHRSLNITKLSDSNNLKDGIIHLFKCCLLDAETDFLSVYKLVHRNDYGIREFEDARGRGEQYAPVPYTLRKRARRDPPPWAIAHHTLVKRQKVETLVRELANALGVVGTLKIDAEVLATEVDIMTSRPIFWAWYEDGLLTTGNPILAHTTIIDDAGTPVGTFGELVMLLYGHNYRVCPWNSTYCVEPIWGDLRIETYTTVCGLARYMLQANQAMGHAYHDEEQDWPDISDDPVCVR